MRTARALRRQIDWENLAEEVDELARRSTAACAYAEVGTGFALHAELSEMLRLRSPALLTVLSMTCRNGVR
jgi:hypothetical protein